MRTTCAWCGEIDTPAASVRCAIDGAGREGLIELDCPRCGRLVLIATDAAHVATRLLHGAVVNERAVPFELLEPRVGPPLTYDDLLDLHLALERNDLLV